MDLATDALRVISSAVVGSTKPQGSYEGLRYTHWSVDGTSGASSLGFGPNSGAVNMWMYISGLGLLMFGNFQLRKQSERDPFSRPQLRTLLLVGEIVAVPALLGGFFLFKFWIPLLGFLVAPSVLGIAIHHLTYRMMPAVGPKAAVAIPLGSILATTGMALTWAAK
jgi:hypothetical protein